MTPTIVDRTVNKIHAIHNKIVLANSRKIFSSFPHAMLNLSSLHYALINTTLFGGTVYIV